MGPIELELFSAVEEDATVPGTGPGGTVVMLFIGPVSVLKPASRLEVRLDREAGPSDDKAVRMDEATA